VSSILRNDRYSSAISDNRNDRGLKLSTTAQTSTGLMFVFLLHDGTLRANKRETTDWLKFTLEGAGERTHGYAFTDTTFAGCWI
jgi:hypothetical protein